MVVTCHVGARIELGSSVRAASSLNHRALFPAPGWGVLISNVETNGIGKICRWRWSLFWFVVLVYVHLVSWLWDM